MLARQRLQTLTIPWNLFLILTGSVVFAVGVKAGLDPLAPLMGMHRK